MSSLGCFWVLVNSVVSPYKHVSISVEIKGIFWLGVREKSVVFFPILASVPDNESLEWEHLIPFRIHSMLPLGNNHLLGDCLYSTCTWNHWRRAEGFRVWNAY